MMTEVVDRIQTVGKTLGCILKDRHDLGDLRSGELEPLVAGAREVPPP